jgi:molybdopterin biosynthesis enzyme
VVLFGVIERAGRAPCLYFALPGNPGASALTFDLLVRPAMRRMMQASQVRSTEWAPCS